MVGAAPPTQVSVTRDALKVRSFRLSSDGLTLLAVCLISAPLLPLQYDVIAESEHIVVDRNVGADVNSVAIHQTNGTVNGVLVEFGRLVNRFYGYTPP